MKKKYNSKVNNIIQYLNMHFKNGKPEGLTQIVVENMCIG